MIAVPLKKYTYTLYFSTHEWEFTTTTSPENMHRDFDSGEVVMREFQDAIFFVDFSKVFMIMCKEEVDFADLPKDE